MVGLTGFVWLAVWWPVYRTPAERAARGATAPASRVPVRQLLRSRFVLAFTFSKIFMDPVWYFYIFWFPVYREVTNDFHLFPPLRMQNLVPGSDL